MGTTKTLEIDNFEKRILAMREERRMEKARLERLKNRLHGKMERKTQGKNAGNAA